MGLTCSQLNTYSLIFDCVFSVISKGTFDLQPKGSSNEFSYKSGVSVRQIPHLPSLTICVWNRFLSLFSALSWSLVSYRKTTGSKSQYFGLAWHTHTGNQMSLVVTQKTFSTESTTSKERYGRDVKGVR